MKPEPKPEPAAAVAAAAAEAAAAAAAAASDAATGGATAKAAVKSVWLGSAKLEAMVVTLDKLMTADKDQKCIVFSNFTSFLNLAERHLEVKRKAGHKFKYHRDSISATTQMCDDGSIVVRFAHLTDRILPYDYSPRKLQTFTCRNLSPPWVHMYL